MDLAKFALFFAMSGVEESAGDPPSGSPSNLWVSRYGGPDKWRPQWDNGDAAAYTRVYYGSIGDSFAESSLLRTELPGATSSDTGLAAGIPEPPPPETQYVFWLVHYRNGVEHDTPVSVNTTGF